MKFDRDKLQALLARVQRNSALPRTVPAPVSVAGAAASSVRPAGPASVAPASAVDAPLPASGRSIPPMALELDEPGLDSMTPPSAGPAGNELDLDEPPESGSAPVRPAAARPSDLLDDADHPPLTPPPESGEEPAPKVTIPRDTGPTMAQLGQTIALEEATNAALELEEPPAPPSRRGVDQLEMVPPTGGYSEELPLPDNAREELDRVRLGQSTEVGPTVHVRPVLSTNVVDFVSAVRSYQPETFVELLDASLKL